MLGTSSGLLDSTNTTDEKLNGVCFFMENNTGADDILSPIDIC
jgi:hypothetical protein